MKPCLPTTSCCKITCGTASRAGRRSHRVLSSSPLSLMTFPDDSLDGHTLDEDGEHDEEGCWQCLHSQTAETTCRCGECCRRLIVEVELEDAEREPKIKEFGSPIYM